MDEHIINSIAALKKFEIENSRRTRDEKEWEKAGVDCLAAILKSIRTYPEQQFSVMGLDIERIRLIKKAAEQYSLKKVILFPYISGRNVISLMRAYGGNQKQFFQSLGCDMINSDISSEVFSECDRLEREYGIILYESI